MATNKLFPSSGAQHVMSVLSEGESAGLYIHVTLPLWQDGLQLPSPGNLACYDDSPWPLLLLGLVWYIL